MKIPYVLCFAILTCLSTLSVKANELPIAMLGGKQSITIPFQFINGYIVTEVQINEVLTLECIFDTGAEHTLLFNPILADILSMTFSDTVRVYGTDFVDYRKAYITRDSELQIGTGESIDYDLLFLEGDIYNFRELVGYQIDGILGLSFFKNLGISIDYVKKRITVFNPKAIGKYVKKDFVEEPITVHNHKPYIKILNSSQESQVMLLDSGADLSMLEYIQDKSSITTNYVEGVLGRGLGGDIVGYAGISGSKTILGRDFQSAIVNYQVKTADLDSFLINTDLDREGLIGNQMLKQFDIVLNLLSSTIYTRPNKYYSSTAVYNKTGIEPMVFGRNFNQYFVHSVVKSSPAYEVDIRRGDIILGINRLPMWFWNINSIKRLFSSKRDKAIRLKLKRDKDVIEKVVLLRDYLK